MKMLLFQYQNVTISIPLVKLLNIATLEIPDNNC